MLQEHWTVVRLDKLIDEQEFEVSTLKTATKDIMD